mmetsp:Transcript_5131/g.10435  ORF Transcript_5131/g.10435 Transcript_5131/m.10435 type:complete len:418 (-) Transcript_5131:1918-3171(-)
MKKSSQAFVSLLGPSWLHSNVHVRSLCPFRPSLKFSRVVPRRQSRLVSVRCSGSSPASGVPEEVIEEWVRQTPKLASFPSCDVVISSAWHIPGVLADFWGTVLYLRGERNQGREAASVFAVAQCAKLTDETTLWERILSYLYSCADICDDFGVAITMSPIRDERAPCPSVLLQARSNKAQSTEDDDDWDDWGSEDSLLAKYGLSGETSLAEVQMSTETQSDEAVVEKTLQWVQAMIVDFGICPFTSSSAHRAGVPVGDVRYAVSRARDSESLLHEYWSEVSKVINTDERSLSTTLLITPDFAPLSSEMFDSFSSMLTAPMEPLEIENDIQLVIFHPDYNFRDGAERVGRQTEANYARRSPYPMLNILRTSQVRTAQRAIPTGLVYEQNEAFLKEVGAENLQKMLESGDWSLLTKRQQ